MLYEEGHSRSLGSVLDEFFCDVLPRDCGAISNEKAPRDEGL
jgi:hypothetical protein